MQISTNLIIFSILLIFASCKIQEINLLNESERNINFADLLSQSKRNLRANGYDESENISSDEDDKCYQRPLYGSPNSYYFLPVLKGKLLKVGDKIEFQSRCFLKNVATLTELSKEKAIITLESSQKAKEKFCLQVFLIHATNINTISSPLDEGKLEIRMNYLTDDDIAEIGVNGIKIYGFCNGLINSVISIVKTGLSVLSGFGMDPESINPILRPYMKEGGIQIKQLFESFRLYNKYDPKRRTPRTLKINPRNIHTGDVIAVMHYGYDSFMVLLTGGRVTHTGVCAWIDGDLYVLESMEAPYWPDKGFQKHKYEDWIKLAENAGYDIALLQLRDDIRSHFDDKAAIEWFESKSKLPYGKRNSIFAHIDTVSQNLPYSMQHEHLELILSVLEKIDPKLANAYALEGLNMRLGTKGKTLNQIAAEAAKNGKSIEQLFAEPEQDGWEYSDGENYCCSCMVIEFFKKGNLFKGLDILSREFTPKDLYELDFFEKEPDKRMQECIDADPELPYCQLSGRFKMELPYFSSVTPYSHMNEKCATIAPEFKRQDKC